MEKASYPITTRKQRETMTKWKRTTYPFKAYPSDLLLPSGVPPLKDFVTS
jgi:hypothetical protein